MKVGNTVELITTSRENKRRKMGKVIGEYEHFFLIEVRGVKGTWKETISKQDLECGCKSSMKFDDVIVKDLESEFEKKVNASKLEGIYLDQGITQGIV